MPQKVISGVDEAVEKLIDASKVIEQRLGVTEAQKKRVESAFTLLGGRSSAGSKGGKQQKSYLDFLLVVQRVVGPSGVVLCAAGLGQSAVANMKNRIRVGLPFKMKQREEEFKKNVLQSLADVYSIKIYPQTHHITELETLERDIEQPLSTGKSNPELNGDTYNFPPDSPPTDLPAASPLTGDVYRLTTTDAPAIIDDTLGQIWLTDPYDDHAQPFVTIQISWKLRDQFIAKRLKVM